MNVWYILGGLASIGLGGYIIFIQIKTFIKGEQDQLGFDIKLLGGGIGFLIVGIAIIAKYI